MEITLLIKSMIGLVAVLGVLLFLFFYSRSVKESETAKKVQQKEKKPPHDLQTLKKIIKNQQTSKEKLKEALDLVLEYHGTIHKKNGGMSHSDFDIYAEIVFLICRHPNTTKDLILNFDRALESKNPDYKREINDALTMGLNSRGA